MATRTEFYEIRHRVLNSEQPFRVERFPADSTTITIRGLLRGVQYEIQARSIAGSLTSGWVEVTTEIEGAVRIPQTPLSLTAISVADGVSLKWLTDQPLASGDEWCIERADAVGGPFSEFTRTGAMQYTLPLTAAVERFFRVRSRTFASMFSAYSLVVSGTPVSVADLTIDAAANAAAIAAEEAARISALAAESSARIAGLAAEAANRATELAAEATARATAIATERAAREAGIAAAQARISEITADSIISADEKPKLILDLAALLNERSGILAEAAASEVTAESAAYDASITALVNYMNTLTTPVRWDNTAGNTNIT